MSRLKPPFMSQDKGCFCCPPPPTPSSSSLAILSNSKEMRGEESIFPGDNLNAALHSLDLSHHKSTCVSNSNNDECNQSLDPTCLNTLMENIDINNQNRIIDTSKDSNIITQPLQYYNDVSPIENTQSDCSDVFLSSPSLDMKMNFRTLQSRQLGSRFSHPNDKYCLSSSAPIVGSRACNEKPSSVSMSDKMDLDLALDELGMLSTITKSRRDYLLEMRGSSSALKRERRLRSKSESSPNLSSHCHLNGLRIVQVDSNYVTSVFSSSSPSLGIASQPTFPMCDLATPPVRSQSVRMEYRDPDILEASSLARRRRSVPRMSRLRSGRYGRSSRCPYKVPNRLCNSMQESDFDLEGFQNCYEAFSSCTSLPDPAREQSIPPAGIVNKVNSSLIISSPSSQHHSKSNTNSPIKPCQDQPLVRSLSVEDLHSTPARKLALLFEVQAHHSKEEEAHVEQIASQFTDLHMS